MVSCQALQLLLQELLDVTRGLLADMDRDRQSAAQTGSSYGAPSLNELKLDADQDELREKFGIVRVSLYQPPYPQHVVTAYREPSSPMILP